MVPAHGTGDSLPVSVPGPEAARRAGGAPRRIAPPDSLRFDYVGPLGLGAGAAIVVGDSTVWADPEPELSALVPGIPMLWAALGIVRPPAPDAQVERGGTESRSVMAVHPWRRHARLCRDRMAVPRLLEAEWRRKGKVLARSRTEFDGHRVTGDRRG